MAKCIFCGKEQADYLGTFLIKNDGTMVYYCSNKCRKNHLTLGRDKRKLKWTAAFRETREKRILKAAQTPAKKVPAKKASKS